MYNRIEYMEEENQHKLHFLILGDCNVGKSSIINRFTEKTFVEFPKCPMEINFKKTCLNFGDQQFCLHLWSMHCHELTEANTIKYINKINTIILVYSITNKESFEHICQWLKIISKMNTEKIHIVLMGNKCDLNDDRKVSSEEAEKISVEYKTTFCEASACTNINISRCFQYTIGQIVEESIDKKKQKKKGK